MCENERSFYCEKYRDGCHFTLWKDTLTRGGGPELSEKLVKLLLEKKTVAGSTGTITMNQQAIAFYPKGQEAPSITRPLVYEKNQPK